MWSQADGEGGLYWHAKFCGVVHLGKRSIAHVEFDKWLCNSWLCSPGTNSAAKVCWTVSWVGDSSRFRGHDDVAAYDCCTCRLVRWVPTSASKRWPQSDLDFGHFDNTTSLCGDLVGLRTGDKCLIICTVYMDGEEVGSEEVPLAVILLFCK